MTAPLLITVLFFKKSLIFLETLKSWFLPFLDIFACQQILKEPSCEAVTESFFFFWFVWLDHEGRSQLSFRSSDHMFTDVVGQIFTGGLFSRSSGFTKHWYTFHWKAQIKLFPWSVTLQIIFTDYGATKCDTLTCALWDKQVMQCFDSSVSQRQISTAEPVSDCCCLIYSAYQCV